MPRDVGLLRHAVAAPKNDVAVRLDEHRRDVVAPGGSKARLPSRVGDGIAEQGEDLILLLRGRERVGLPRCDPDRDEAGDSGEYVITDGTHWGTPLGWLREGLSLAAGSEHSPNTAHCT